MYITLHKSGSTLSTRVVISCPTVGVGMSKTGTLFLLVVRSQLYSGRALLHKMPSTKIWTYWGAVYRNLLEDQRGFAYSEIVLSLFGHILLHSDY